MLDHGDRRLREVVRRAPCRIRVNVVVVRHFLALHLARAREAGGPVVVRVQRRALVRVLSVAQRRGASGAEADPTGEAVHIVGRYDVANPRGDRDVVRGRVAEGGDGEQSCAPQA